MPGGSAGASEAAAAVQARAGAAAIAAFSQGSRDANGASAPRFVAEIAELLRPSALISILTDQTTGYLRLVSLLNDDTRLTGSAQSDRIETGAWNNTVAAGDGGDIVFKWRPGDLTFRCGGGLDTLSLAPDVRVADPPLAVEQLVLDLAKGTGRNPLGGALKVASVEAVIDTRAADVIRGSARAETVTTDFLTAGDTFRMRGGDDLVRINAPAFGTSIAGARIDGGPGFDRLEVNLIGAGASILNLGNPARNAGAFADAVIRGVEAVALGVVSDATALRVVGTGAAETVRLSNFVYRGASLNADLRSGNDTAIGGLGNDTLAGGKGREGLSGGTGDDILRGGSGADSLVGGEGTTRFPAGPDLVTFVADFGADVIRDFRPGEDRIDFAAHAGVARRVALTFARQGDDTRITAPGGDTILVEGVAPGDLPGSVFLC